MSGTLNSRTKKDLADMARRKGVKGFDRMDKDALVKALNKLTAKPVAKPVPKPAPKPVAKSAAKVTKPSKPAPAKAAKPIANGSHKPINRLKDVLPPKSASKLPPASAKVPAPAVKTVVPAKAAPVLQKSTSNYATSFVSNIPAEKDLSGGKAATGTIKDKIYLMVPDPYWLHATWDLSHQSVQRAEAALRQDWHGARPIIRLFDVTSTDTTSTSETPMRDIIVHGGCNNWYIDIQQPPRQYRADIGYLSRRGEFFVLARSNVVTPPKAGSAEAVNVGWSDVDPKKAERILAMSTGFESTAHPELKELFEEKFRRPMGPSKDTAFGTGAALPGSMKKFFFDIDAELIVYGKTDPSAHVTLQNEPVKLRPDGTFTMLFSLPDSRQIIPAVATIADGSEERTIVLAVERNTKHLDPMIHDQMNDG
jgi:hypothetical protein